jgi:hypothetical protein
MKGSIPILIALLSGLFSLLATLVAIRNARSVENLKAQLSNEAAERAARRDYEYEALKRLYAEVEPIRFQLVEASESAASFIEGLARRSTKKEIPGSLPDGNYLSLATIYTLLLPAACFRILSRQVTLVDLQLSPPIHLQYLIAKHCYLAFTHDAMIARIAGLLYTPYSEGWQTLRETDPHTFRRQGFALGRLDNALDELIHPLGDRVRLLSFGEWEAKMYASRKDPDGRFAHYNSALGAAVDLFADFDINSRPVLWRILVVQYILYRMLLSVYREEQPGMVDLQEHLRPAEGMELLDIGESSATLGPVDSAREYAWRHILPLIETQSAKSRGMRTALPSN